ncbi:MAG: hypothetical protein QE271_13345 [Bacteriovoracaceae bacterium]|nr:hypothetical protein [Bacteriovoracaceae bacterium]
MNKLFYFCLLQVSMIVAMIGGVQAQNLPNQRPCRGNNLTLNEGGSIEVKNRTMRNFSQSTCRLECTVKSAPREERGYRDIFVESTLPVGIEITEKVVKEIQDKLEFKCTSFLRGTVVSNSFNFCKNY